SSLSHTHTTEIYTLSLHDALPIYAKNAVIQPVLGDVAIDPGVACEMRMAEDKEEPQRQPGHGRQQKKEPVAPHQFNELCHDKERSEEHTSELQSRSDLVCRLLLEK